MTLSKNERHYLAELVREDIQQWDKVLALEIELNSPHVENFRQKLEKMRDLERRLIG